MSIYYPGLKNHQFQEHRNYIVDKLVALRAALAGKIPNKTLDRNLLVATWNLRDFGRTVGGGFNPEPRFGESFYYIAEVMDRFDIIAVQEVNEDLTDFERLMDILGRHYSYMATDVTEGRAGNDERTAFIYDTRKVSFRNIAGEIVLPGGKTKTTQFARTPYVVSFQCGWFKFDLCTAHLYYGQDSGEAKQRRVDEIADLGKFMHDRALKTGTNTFILGDFNVVGPDDPTWEALRDSGFTMPEQIRTIRTNQSHSKHYDQIAFTSAKQAVRIATQQPAGTFEIYDHVFTTSDEDHYRPIAKNMTKTFKEWRSWQISDHLPLWIHLETDFADNYLVGLKST